MQTEWGRDERTDWPNSKPVYTIVLLILSVAAGAGVEYVRALRVWTPLERHYLLTYIGTEIAATVRQNGSYTLLELLMRKGSRLALASEVVLVVTANGEKTFALTSEAVKQGALRLEWHRALYENAKLHAFLGDWIYHDQTLFDLARPALWTAPIVFLVGVWPATWMERKRIRALRYGRKLRGPDLITVAQFNWRHRRSRGIGFGNADRTALQRILALNSKLHIPLIKENRHFEIMGDTGAGRSRNISQRRTSEEQGRRRSPRTRREKESWNCHAKQCRSGIARWRKRSAINRSALSKRRRSEER